MIYQWSDEYSACIAEWEKIESVSINRKKDNVHRQEGNAMLFEDVQYYSRVVIAPPTEHES